MCALYARVRGTCTSIRVNLIVGLMGAGEQGAAYTTLPGATISTFLTNTNGQLKLKRLHMCFFKNYIPDMLPVHNVSIYIDVAHIEDAVIFVLLLCSILCHTSRYSYICLKTIENMLNMQFIVSVWNWLHRFVTIVAPSIMCLYCTLCVSMQPSIWTNCRQQQHDQIKIASFVLGLIIMLAGYFNPYGQFYTHCRYDKVK